ncbi:DUF6387 family protein [Pseudomonas khavaziana]|uniref:DUF6387 family protein n=1 Tax=Pseudomonas khavaziana TaxID=2842351 RepID=UPI001C3E6297|nr:DUF6387 family protein [Pseudomonas khavaziana]MBV4480548.1 hypothetical protein [Pseudomonas khavaziana]
MARLSNAIKKSDIPSWFVLSKYAFASELDSAGWYEQILAREQLFLMMGHRKNCGGPPNEKDLASRLGSEIWLDAKVSFKGPGILPSICGHDGAVGRISSSYAKSVHSLTYRQFLQQDERIKSEAKEKAKQWWENISAPDFGSEKIDMDLAYQVMEFVDLPLHASQNRTSLHAIADVDLSMPDAILVDAFKAWLATVREELHLDSPKQYRRPDFSSWVRLGVLPYLDLVSWAELTGQSIPNRLMASLLFPAGDGGEETIRKTTAPIAMEMIGRGGYSDRTILDTLLAVAAHEGRELGGG